MKIHYAMILFVAVILTSVLVFADTTFFDNPDDAFIMGNSPITSPTGEAIEGTTNLGNCLTNWVCNSWSGCINGIQQRNCAKEKSYCYADLKEKPIESQNCSIETEKQNETQKPQIKIKIFIFVFIIIAVIILFASKIFRRRRHKKYGY